MKLQNLYPVVEIKTGKIMGTHHEGDPSGAYAAAAELGAGYQALVMPGDFRLLTVEVLVLLYNAFSIGSVEVFASVETGVSQLRRFLQPHLHDNDSSRKENVMTAKKASTKKAGTKKASAKKASAKKASTKKASTKKTMLNTTREKVVKARTSVEAGGYRSAAAMFKALITEAKLSDDEIFSSVQKAFGLDDNKRRYVAWYRQNMARKAS